jgi:hypothetical protein
MTTGCAMSHNNMIHTYNSNYYIEQQHTTCHKHTVNIATRNQNNSRTALIIFLWSAGIDPWRSSIAISYIHDNCTVMNINTKFKMQIQEV